MDWEVTVQGNPRVYKALKKSDAADLRRTETVGSVQ